MIKKITLLFLIGMSFCQNSLADLTDAINDEASEKPTPKPVDPILEPKTEKTPVREEVSEPKPIKKSSNVKKKKNERKKHVVRSTGQDKAPVYFKGGSLKGSKMSGLIVLEKDVEVEKGTLTLKADLAKIFFDDEGDEVDSIFAQGHLKMEKIDDKSGEKIVAQGNTAEYAAKDQVVILRGDAELTKGKDVISGDYIRYNLATGIVEGGKIKGLVQPAQ